MTAAVERIALNAVWLSPGDSGGPETYLRELVPALAREYPRLRMTVYTTGSGRRALAADGFAEIAELRALPVEEYRRVRRTVSEQLILPVAARRSGAQLLHNLGSTAPILDFGLPSVVTLHDVTFMHLATFGRVTTWGMSRVVDRASRHADALIAVSTAARDDICVTLGIDPARFTVVSHGVTAAPRAKPSEERALRERLDLPVADRIVLCVAAIRPHKNQELLVRAIPLLQPGVLVVLAGRHEPYAARVAQLARDLGVSERLRMPGYLADGDLEGLWEIADCAAFPTLAEGFGMPLLEAMARGLPAACSDIPVLREVGGDAPCYFDPAEAPDAARAVSTAIGDPERGRLGVERAGRFSWAEAARGTMEAYEMALSRSDS